jgi:hypothetical protein
VFHTGRYVLVYTKCNSLLQTSFITFRNGFDYNGLRTHELPRRNASYLSTRIYKFTHNMHNMPVREEDSTNASGESYELSTCPPGELTQEQNYFLLVAAPGCSEFDVSCVVMLSNSLTASSKPSHGHNQAIKTLSHDGASLNRCLLTGDPARFRVLRQSRL